MPDQTLCFQFVYLIQLTQVRKIKPIILEQVEKYFKINLNERLYFKLIRENDTFKEYFIRKLDEHVNFKEFHQILYRKSQIFERIEIAQDDKIGTLQIFEINQHCFIKNLIQTFYTCYTFTCSTAAISYQFDNKTFVLDDEPIDYIVNGFTKYRIKQRYLLSYQGKNIVFKIVLNKKLFIRNGLENFLIQLHEANKFPKNMQSLTHVQGINQEGFRQLYTYTFLHVKRLASPYRSNCTRNFEFLNKARCEDKLSRDYFSSLLFGNYYPFKRSYDNLSLGLNLQYFFYQYNSDTLDKITADCLIKTSLDKCEEYIYYIFSNLALPCDEMILQLMVPINANYLCADRPKLALSEYLLKGLSIVNFWFGFTIVQMLFNLHDDVGVLFKRTVKHKDRDKNQIILKNQLNNFNNKPKDNLIDRLFRSNKKCKSSDDCLLNSYLDNLAINRAILLRNLQNNNWIYNPLTYSEMKQDDDLIFKRFNNNFQNSKNLDLNKIVNKAANKRMRNDQITNVIKDEIDKNEIDDKVNRLNDSHLSNRNEDNQKVVDDQFTLVKHKVRMPIKKSKLSKWALIKNFLKKNLINRTEDENNVKIDHSPITKPSAIS